MCLSVLWLHYRFPLHIINLMRNYLCHKEHSNDLWLTKSVTCELRTQLIDDVYIQSIVQDSLFTETIFFHSTWYQIISNQRVPLIICCPRCQGGSFHKTFMWSAFLFDSTGVWVFGY